QVARLFVSRRNLSVFLCGFRSRCATPVGPVGTMSSHATAAAGFDAAQPRFRATRTKGGTAMSIVNFRALSTGALTVAVGVIAGAALAQPQFGAPPQPRPEATLAAAP